MKNVLLIKYGEIALRGKNRGQFETKLILNIRKNLDGLGNFYVVKEQGRFILENLDGDIDYDLVIPKVKVVIGIVGIAKCVKIESKNLDEIKEVAFNVLKDTRKNEKTFKVISKRADKNFPLKSNELSIEVGEYLYENTDLEVDVKKPEIKINVEIRSNVYIYANTIKTIGGLPYGSSGKGVLLLSGGIDSPVAGFLMAKRGVELICVYFHSPPYTSERAKIKVCDLAKRLSDFTGGIKLYVVPFTKTQLYLYDKVAPEKITILLKRAMIKIGEKISEKEKGLGLIMGDSVGQVASQTMHSINAINSATTLPLYRPLTSFDKQEIIDLAKEIGTYDISSRPYEDCCTIFVAKHPETKPKRSIIESIDKNLDIEELLNEAVDESEIIQF